MALTIVNAPALNIGDTVLDRPASPPASELFFDKSLSQLTVFDGGVWRTAAATLSVTTMTALKAIAAANRFDDLRVFVRTDESFWVFRSTSVLTGDDILIATPASGTGRWLRMPGGLDLALPFTFATADAALLLTFAANAVFVYQNAYFQIDSSMTGGTTPSIGVSSSNKTGFTTKGDIIGATLTAALTAGIRPGTVGTGVDSVTKLHSAVFVGGDTIRFDRIADAFTSGSGSVHLAGVLAANPGA